MNRRMRKDFRKVCKMKGMMKKINIAVAYDEEKLSALKLYLEQKGQKVEMEIEKSLDALYNKTVPTGVREYLSLRSGEKVPVKGKGKMQKEDESSFFAIGDEGGEE